MINLQKTPFQYKGYTVNYINGEYRAECHTEITFYSRNLTALKTAITGYLNSQK